MHRFDAQLPLLGLARSVDRTRGRLVHVVDDEDAIRRSLDFLLRTAGYSVACWATGEDFVNGADKTVPSCVLLDFLMPGTGGLKVQQLMAIHGLDFPVIVMTGSGDPTMTLRAMMAGAVDLIEKPFDRARLLHTISAAFDRLFDRVSVREERIRAGNQIANLTSRERAVLDGLAHGYPNKTIAHELGISIKSVEVYRANAMDKLQVDYFADALRIALAGGLGAERGWRDKYGVDQKCAQ